MLQNARVTALSVSELLRENRQGGIICLKYLRNEIFNLKVKLNVSLSKLLIAKYCLYFVFLIKQKASNFDVAQYQPPLSAWGQLLVPSFEKGESE